jgi:two-component system, LytTR family, response regulator
MKNKYKVAIVDDEEVCISNLCRALDSVLSFSISGTANTAKDAVPLILRNQPDLLFLDVEMPDKSGLELLRELRQLINWPMQVVFYTAYEKYLLEALRESAFDYLLKPFEQNEFHLVLNRFLEHQQKPSSISFDEHVSRLLPNSQTFIIATVSGYQILHAEQIVYFEFKNGRKFWTVVLSDLSSFFLKRNSKAEDILCYSDLFIQINQHQILNIEYLSSINGKKCILIPPFQDDFDLLVSRSYQKGLQERFFLI